MKNRFISIIAAVLLAVSPLVAVAEDAEKITNLFGVGISVSCKEAVDAEETGKLSRLHNMNWLLGYISAINLVRLEGTGYKNVTALELYEEALKYCRKNPSEDWILAASASSGKLAYKK